MENEIPRQGIVYGIYHDDVLLYVGSTIDLHRRISEHNSDCYNENSDKYNKTLYRYIRNNNIDFRNDCSFRILETVSNYKSQDDKSFLKILRQHENLHIEKINPSQNERKAYQSEEECKIYRNANNICDVCNGKYITQNKSRHLKTQKHRKAIKLNEKSDDKSIKININININRDEQKTD
jgi:hypothetical protein